MKSTETSDANVLSILATLEKIGKRMLNNRASEMEVLVYQACLLLKAKNGGGLEYADEDYNLAKAVSIVDSMWRMTQLGPLEDITKYLELPFDLPSYPSETYVEAFHALLKDSSYVPMFYKCRDITVPLGFRKHFFRLLAGRYYEFVQCLLPKKSGTALDFCGKRIPEGVSFNEYDKYIICETDELLYAYLVFRKDMEGDAWSNVEIVNKIPGRAEKFDVVFIHNWEAIDGIPLADDALIVFQQPPHESYLGETIYPEITATGWLEMVISFISPEIHNENILFILRKGRDSEKPITFVNGGSYVNRFSPFISKDTAEQILAGDPGFVVSVPVTDINPANLLPCYYLLKSNLHGESTAPLGKFVTIANKIEPADDETFDREINKITTDDRLISTNTVERDDFFNFGIYKLSDISLLIELRKGGWDVGFVEVDDSPILVNNDAIVPFIVKPELADVRFLVMVLRRIVFPTPQNYFVSDEDVLYLPIPDLSLEEQRRAVEDYLRTLKESFVSGLSIKESTINILVATPDRETFETKNKDRLRTLGFKVLEYIEDKKSLKAALSEHYGENVLSSNLADAVLICADMPAMDVQKAIYFVGKVGIRTFYYSNNPAFDSKEIDEDYLEDFNEGFVSGEDWLEAIRRKLDAESYKVVDKYPRFFDAAQRLDKEYGWNLVEYATPILSSEPFDMNITKFRETLNNTILAFFQDHHIAPAELEGTAIAAFISDRRFTVSKKGITINLLEEDPGDNTFQKEAWYKHMLVAIRDFGNNDSHTEKEFDSSVKQAAFTIFMEIVIWLNSIRGRYRDRKCLFSIKKDGALLPIHPVESFEIDGRTYLVAGGVHLLDPKRELRDGSQVVILETEADRYPKNINGQLVSKLAKRSGYFIAIKD